MTTEEANLPAEGTTTVDYEAQYKELQAKYESQEKSYKAMQRDLSRAQAQGRPTEALQKEVGELKELTLATLEQFNKLGIEGVDTKPILEKYRGNAEAVKAAEEKQKAAGNKIVSAAAAAGVPQEKFNEAWNDERYAVARALWTKGLYDEAADVFAVELAKAPKEKKEPPPSEEQVKARVEEEVGKRMREQAAVVDRGSGGSAAPKTVEAIRRRYAEINADIAAGAPVTNYAKEMKDLSLGMARALQGK